VKAGEDVVPADTAASAGKRGEFIAVAATTHRQQLVCVFLIHSQMRDEMKSNNWAENILLKNRPK